MSKPGSIHVFLLAVASVALVGCYRHVNRIPPANMIMHPGPGVGGPGPGVMLGDAPPPNPNPQSQHA